MPEIEVQNDNLKFQVLFSPPTDPHMANETNLRVIHSSSDRGPWSRVEWRYPVGLFTTALFLRGAVTLLQLLLPNHLSTAECIAVAPVFAWRFGLHRLGVFPWDWSRARGSSFALLQAAMDAAAFFVFMVVLISLVETPLPREIEIAAVLALFYGLYGGSFAHPRPSKNA